MSIVKALHACKEGRRDILARLKAFDTTLMEKAFQAGGDAYRTLVCASYRHAIAAHKLIADREGRPIFLSKENGSNGCIGTADVTYPSIPLFLLYSPGLVRAMARPILHFAGLPAWRHDYAPHDVGRYPYATGQVYGLSRKAFSRAWFEAVGKDGVYPPLYALDPDGLDMYDAAYQMPVEECGNMLLIVAAAMRADGDVSLAREYLPLLDKWAQYLENHGGDPENQLCTDDFAGHLAGNVNLAFKAAFGMAAYAWMLQRLGDGEKAARYQEKSAAMAKDILARARHEGHTALTFGGGGWSLKYNTVWDRLFGFNLLEEGFFREEVKWYLDRQNIYGTPLDCRADYTKSDWVMWASTLDGGAETVAAFAAPLARYLAETASRYPFPDWYETGTGDHHQFIARSVQGGIFMPLLREAWKDGQEA